MTGEVTYKARDVDREPSGSFDRMTTRIPLPPFKEHHKLLYCLLVINRSYPFYSKLTNWTSEFKEI
jgi:hypothetical protein